MEEFMLVKSVYSILFILAMVCSSTAQVMRPDDIPMPPVIEAPKVEFRMGAVHPTQTLLTEIVTWLSSNFDLPAIPDHPRIEFVSSAKLASMRYEDSGSLGDPSRVTSAYVPVETARQGDVVALYNDRTKTMFLSDKWTGTTPAELSVVVHEMVHHLQNLGKLEFECPQAREKQAYKAQNQWLEQFGKNLETEFELDKFTVFISTTCTY
jgi:hypothetical protein